MYLNLQISILGAYGRVKVSKIEKGVVKLYLIETFIYTVEKLFIAHNGPISRTTNLCNVSFNGLI